MQGDRERWDARYSSGAVERERAPDPQVADVLGRLAGAGTALDLASGTGRHALLLAELGYRVSAWDVSGVALAQLERHAHKRGLSLATTRVDLSVDGFPEHDPFDVVVVVDFLDRTLLARLSELLAPGGSAVVATFTDDWPDAHPSARFRLRPGELKAGLPGLAVVHHEESAGRALLWATKPG